MIKRSKKIIASLLMALTLVSVLPCTQTFANSKDGVQQKYTKVNDKMTFQYLLNGELLTNQWYEYDVPLASIDKDGKKTLFDDHHKIYLDENGCKAHGWRVIDGETYYLGAKGVRMLKGESGKFEKYLFDEDGRLITDPVKVKYSDKEYTISDDDKSITMTLDGVTYNVPKDQAVADEKILEKDGKYYIFFFDQTNGGFHIKKSSAWGDYYAKEDGTLAVNEWAKDEQNKWGYYGADFKPITGFQIINGVKYYFGGNGDLRIGWFYIDNEGHYSYPDGSIKEGWVNTDRGIHHGVWYYVYSDGKVAEDTITPDGYRVNRIGIWDPKK